MKKSILLLAIILMLSSVSFGAPCAQLQTQLSTFLAGLTNGACQLGDKNFSNFSADPTIGASTSISFGSIGNQFTVLLADSSQGGFANNFFFNYVISVIPGLDPQGNATTKTFAITDVRAGLITGSAVASLTKNVAGKGSATSFVNGNNQVQTPLSVNASSLTINDQYSFTSGLVIGLQNTYTQTDTTLPEPASLALVGAGLLAAGIFGRKLRKV